jgi:DNA-directed RNA polymerase specialized sigma24 family protein
MNFLNSNQVARNCVSQYATSQDFRHVFVEDMADLYRLAFLLTADHDKAEQCFAAGLDDCLNANRVFKEWARPWAKSSIIQQAIRTLQPRPDHGVSSAPATVLPESKPITVCDEHLEVNRVSALEQFQRFVFVMSVLEHYSEHACAELLGCSLQDIRIARARALGQLVDSDRVFCPR